jgi:hypothetical protein
MTVLDEAKVKALAEKYGEPEERIAAIARAIALKMAANVKRISRELSEAGRDATDREAIAQAIANSPQIAQGIVEVARSYQINPVTVIEIVSAFSADEMKVEARIDAQGKLNDANCPLCANPLETALPVVREVLDEELQCPDHPDDPHPVEMMSECHPEAGLRAFYCAVHGALSLFCNECSVLHSTLQIASEEEE